MKRMDRLAFGVWLCSLLSCVSSATSPLVAQETAPDIRSIEPDLSVPEMKDSPPKAGNRVRWYPLPESQPDLYGVLTLPDNYAPDGNHPLIIELPGNGGYRSPFGDECSGRPEGCNLGWGISEGRDFVWLALPFVTGSDLDQPQEIALQWWGSPPEFSSGSTAAFCQAAIDQATMQFSIDPNAIVLCGFSRGAIACNFVGLQDDAIAQRWCGMIAYSHYDGSRDWGLPNTDRDSARQRLTRLSCPQLICHEADDSKLSGLERTRAWLEETSMSGSDQLQFLSTGFRNHNDAWVLRPSPARKQLRKWVYELPPIQEYRDRKADR